MGNTAQSAGDIDILSPSGNSDIQADSIEPVYEANNQGDDSAIVEENDGLAERASSGMDAQGNESTTAQRSESSGDKMTASQQGETTQSIPIPEDIGDGRGDNIVQRQIREAAMKESDPVLRDRLWDEYRKIDNQ